MNKYQLHAALIRLLFKYNLFPETPELEQDFKQELVELLEI